MTTPTAQKLEQIRLSEGLNHKQFSELSGIVYRTLSGDGPDVKSAGLEVIMKFLQRPQFTKYTLWFMTDQITPEAGQITPALAHSGQDVTTS